MGKKELKQNLAADKVISTEEYQTTKVIHQKNRRFAQGENVSEEDFGGHWKLLLAVGAVLKK